MVKVDGQGKLLVILIISKELDICGLSSCLHSLGHHCVCVLQAFSAPARLDLVRAEVVDAAAAVQLLVLAQAEVRGRDVIVAAPKSPGAMP